MDCATSLFADVTHSKLEQLRSNQKYQQISTLEKGNRKSQVGFQKKIDCYQKNNKTEYFFF